MKIAVTGKGGVGKTSIATGLANYYSDRFSVLGVDADPSLNMASIYGIEDAVPLSQMKDVVGRARLPGGLVKMNPQTDDVIDKYAVKIRDNLHLLVVGTVSKAGTGCLCPENALLRSLLQELVLKRDEVVIIDMEAGLEPMSRGTIRNIDVILIVSEPTVNSLSVAKKVTELAQELGIKSALVVGNKVRDNESQFLSDNLEIFHEIPFDDEFRQAFRNNKFNLKSGFYESIIKLGEKVLECAKVGS